MNIILQELIFIRFNVYQRLIAWVILCVGLLLITGCKSSSTSVIQAYETETVLPTNRTIPGSLNQALEVKNSLFTRREYRIGGGDLVDILVYQVEDVSLQYQVSPTGNIQMPLVGSIRIGGLTVEEAQQEVRKQLSKRFVRDPQVTFSIAEYSANEISVTGQVQSPDIYRVTQGRNPFEMLVMAGGLSNLASPSMHINYKVRDESTGDLNPVRIVVDLDSIFNPKTPQEHENQQLVQDIVLTDGDRIYIPSAGEVYIDGAVNKPGSFAMQRDTTVFSLIALAGGAQWTSSKRNVKVLRKDSNGLNLEYKLNLDHIKKNQQAPFKLKAGDLVLVGHHTARRGLKAFMDYGLRLLFIL